MSSASPQAHQHSSRRKIGKLATTFWVLPTLLFLAVVPSLAWDEVLCDPEIYFKCKESHRCISKSFVCDGENDCGGDDRSDESDCHIPKVSIRECIGGFTCDDGNCIPNEWVCDGAADCGDGSDESRSCGTTRECEGFLCTENNECIAHDKRCDGRKDCQGGLDEINCTLSEFEIDLCKITNHKFLCKNKYKCLDLSNVCDFHEDCEDRSDEGPFCFENARCKTLQCSYTCQIFPDTDPACVCRKGYDIGPSGNCTDIDECKRGDHYAYCDQICTNLDGGYKCSCHEGYHMNEENVCKADGSEGVLLFTTIEEIRAYYLTSKRYETIVHNVNKASSVTYDGKHVYWATYETGEESIFKSNDVGLMQESLFTAGLGLVEDIVVDWITDNIYFTDSLLDRIGVCSKDAFYCSSVIHGNLDQPRSLVLHSTEGTMYFSDWGFRPRISSAGMDGSNVHDLVVDNIEWPNGLAIDFGTLRLFWVDAKSTMIESINFDGTDRQTLYSIPTSHPFAIDIFEDNIYWSDMADKEIHMCNKLSGKNSKPLVRHPKSAILGIHIYHPVLLGLEAENPCSQSSCSDLCLLAPREKTLQHTCACAEGSELSANKRNCTKTAKQKDLIVGSKDELFIIKYTTFGKFRMSKHQIPSQHATMNIGTLAYDSTSGRIAASNSINGDITLYHPTTGEIHTVPTGTTSQISGMDFDPNGNNLYWIDKEKKSVIVMNLNTYHVATLVRDFGGDVPMDLCLIPNYGVMYIAFHNEDTHFHIDQFSMNGQHSSRIHRIEKGFIGPHITLHYDNYLDRIFFSDSGLSKIMSFSREDNVVQEFIDLNKVAPAYPTSVGDHLFWTQFGSNKIYWSSKINSDKLVKSLALDLADVHSLKMISTADKYVEVNHACQRYNGGCSHICIAVGNAKECICPDGISLGNDGKTCKAIDECASNEFRCSDGKCLPHSANCDGKKDCAGGEDEGDQCVVTCPETHFACRNGRTCVELFKLCNHVDDCSDGSDELACYTHHDHCQEGEFRCSSGQCIQQSSKCDTIIDCHDGGDEMDCESRTCTKTQFKCKSGDCIPKLWECDGEIDCKDYSDEHSHCVKACTEAELTCDNGHCVHRSLMCNGEDDCEDGTDERSCSPSVTPIPDPDCNVDQYKCDFSVTKCIPLRSKCDGVQDCPKGDDEHECPACSEDEFQCASRICILKKWHCDNVDDCGDKSDEIDCPKKIEDSDTQKAECEGIKCHDTGFCVGWAQVCDNKPDCHDSSDEGERCGESCENSVCADKCYRTPLGHHCGCSRGFTLSNDGRSCRDINECLQTETCSQFCNNTAGGFICSCLEPAYHLKSDLVTCKARGPEMSYVYATKNEIRMKSKSLFKVDSIFKAKQDFSISGMDVDVDSRLIFWTSDLEGTLNRVSIENPNDRMTIHSLQKPGKLAYDWLSKHVYFVEGDHMINVCSFESKKCSIVKSLPKGVIVDALRIDGEMRILFWSETRGLSNRNTKSVIKQSDMSGNNEKSILEMDIPRVTDIAVDPIHKALYLSNNVERKIERITYDGFEKRTLFQPEGNPVDLNMFEDHLYWLNHLKSSDRGASVRNDLVSKCGLYGTSHMECEHVRLLPHFTLDRIQRLRVFQTALQPNSPNKCHELNCSHLCFVDKTGPVCLCEDGTSVRNGFPCPLKESLFKKKFELESPSYDVNQESGYGWLGWSIFLGFLCLSFTTVFAYLGYRYYLENIQNHQKLPNVHFQNLTYELESPIRSPYPNILAQNKFSHPNLVPGEHQYENPAAVKDGEISFRHNNTMTITKGNSSSHNVEMLS